MQLVGRINSMEAQERMLRDLDLPRLLCRMDTRMEEAEAIHFLQKYLCSEKEEILERSLLLGEFFEKSSREELDQASFRRGREVSLFRRVLAFGIDLPFAGIAGLLLSVLIPGNEQSKGVLLFSAYFVLLPMIWNGTTIGKKVMRIRIVSETGEKAAWHQLLIRAIGLWALLYFVPYLTAAVGSIIADDLVRLAFCGLLCGVWFFFLLFELVRMAMHRRLFYERLSGTREISTVVEKSDDRSRTE